VKPMEKIEGIKILHVDGLGFGERGDVEPRGRKDSSTGPSGNLADQLVNSALRYRSQAPLVDAILREIGIKGGDINGLTAAIKNDSEIEPKSETKKKAKASMK
ncbi:MAG: hypothetical protein GTO24_06330, partial [candidate division Zixibacteria bacterium]|nr:hypothetical protein [candidate division Zixibacteria bacterium]